MTDLIERDKWKYSYDDQYQREIDALELDASQVLIADLKRQLAEAQKEINRLREKLGWVPAVFDTKALRRGPDK